MDRFIVNSRGGGGGNPEVKPDVMNPIWIIEEVADSTKHELAWATYVREKGKLVSDRMVNKVGKIEMSYPGLCAKMLRNLM